VNTNQTENGFLDRMIRLRKGNSGVTGQQQGIMSMLEIMKIWSAYGFLSNLFSVFSVVNSAELGITPTKKFSSEAAPHS